MAPAWCASAASTRPAPTDFSPAPTPSATWPTSSIPGRTVSSASRDASATNGLKLRDYYYNWDSGHRYVLNLRDDETYTRYYRRLGTTTDYWVGSEKVATRRSRRRPIEIDTDNRFGLRGNGVWSFSPSPVAATGGPAPFTARRTSTRPPTVSSPALPAQSAEVVYKVQAANAITSQTIQAQFARTDAAATATISVSVNHGTTWTTWRRRSAAAARCR